MSRKQLTFALSLLLFFSLSLSFLLLFPLSWYATDAQTSSSSADKEPFALIKTVVVDGVESDRADPPAVSILYGGIGVGVGAKPGMLLYVGDRVTTGPKVKLTILYLDKPAEKDNEVTLDVKTDVQLGSLFTWGGRVLASVKGYFETKTKKARWSVQGTEYELVVDGDGTTRLRVLKGAVRVEPGTHVPTRAGNVESDRLLGDPQFLRATFRQPEALAQRAPMEFVAVSGRAITIEREFTLTNTCRRQHVYQVKKPINLDWFQFLGADQFTISGRGTRTIRFSIRLDGTNVPVGTQESQLAFPCLDCDTEPGCGISGFFLPITVRVVGNAPPTPTATATPLETSAIATRMEELTLPPFGRWQKSQASLQGVDETLNWSNEVIIAGEPTYSAQSVVPRFRTNEERTRVFREVRRSSIVNDDPQSKKTLADVYVDWGNGAKAEEELKRLDMAAPETPERLTTLGEAFRLMGDLRRAEELLKKAVSLGPNWFPALNALGNVYLDQAKVEQDKRNYDNARRYLDMAKVEYAKALQAKPAITRGRQNHAAAAQGRPADAEKKKTVAQSNLGEVHLRLGEIAQDSGNNVEALGQFEAAARSFENAARTDQSYQFAFTGLGDVYRETGETLLSQGEKRKADSYFGQSKDNYGRAATLHKDMAEAYVGLGRVLDDTGQHAEARKYYLKATQVRPELPDPHYYLAVALASVDPHAAAEQARAYLKIEREILKHGNKAKDAESIKDGPSSPTPTPTVTPTPSPTSTPTPTPTPSPSPSPPGPLVKIPSMKGDRPEAALEELKRKKLVGQLSNQRDCAATGRVLSTDPPKDVKVAPGTLVTIYVSAAGENAVTMPTLRRSDQKAAEEQLRRLDLHPIVRTRETDRDAPYTVIEQKPEGGKRIPAGCSVELTVAIPIPPVTVPRYLGRNVREVNAPFDGLRLGNVVEADSQMPGGTVLRQSPQPGEVVPRGTAVHLEIATSWVFVPNVMQRSMTDAERIVRAAGLNPEVVGGKPGVEDIVTQQDPPSGTRVRRGSIVRLCFQGGPHNLKCNF